MTRILPWIPLATIIGLSTSLAIVLARPQPNVVIMTVVAPSTPASGIAWPRAAMQCRFFDHPRVGLRLNCW